MILSIAALVLSIAALAFSVAGPIITAVIKRNHERDMFKNKFELKHRHDAIEKYLKSAGRCVFTGDHNDIRDFGEASAEIFMYAPSELWTDIRNLNDGISELTSLSDHNQIRKEKQYLQSTYLSLCEKMSNLRRDLERKDD